MPPLLAIEALSVSYPSPAGSRPLPVLRDLTLILHSGEALGIYGDSGSGKTTLARAIPRLLPPSATVRGRIQHAETDLLQVTPSQMRHIRGRVISYIPQEPSIALNPVMPAGKQVQEVLRAHRSLDRISLHTESRRLLARFFAASQLERIAAAYPHQLSGGERQRIVICQAIAANPSLLIADEPTSALDSIAQREFLDLLLELRRERNLSLLLVSHHRKVLRYVTDRCLQLKEGKLHQ